MPESRTRSAGARRLRRGASAPLIISVDRRSTLSLERQIYSSIRQSILDGRLRAGTRLPPTRTFAADTGVSRTTAVLAFARLATEGYLAMRGSAGTFVAELGAAQPGSAHRASARVPHAKAPRTSPRPERTLQLPSGPTGTPALRQAPTPFRIGEPAVDLFPIRLWARMYARRARRTGTTLLSYSSVSGYRPLRAAIASYVSAARGVHTSADQVILARGAQQAIDLVGRVLLAGGDSVWVEDPGYLVARQLISMTGAVAVPVPVDSDGINVAEGERRCPNARLAYVSPSHQFPLGATMSLSRRLALLAWASRTGSWIVEDDYDSEFRYAGSPIASLQGLDTAQRVIYLGTFSKTVFPSLRLGYLIVPPSLVDVFHRAQAMFDHMAPSLEQATLTEFIESGHFSSHVRRMRGVYAERQRAVLRGIEAELGGVMTASPASTGMHVVAWLTNRALADRTVSEHARLAGVEAPPLSLYVMRAPQPPALLLGFAATRPGQVRAALKLVRSAIERAEAG